VNNVIVVFDKQQSRTFLEDAGFGAAPVCVECSECPPAALGLATLAMRKAGAGMLAIGYAW
jgi:hypothetical protein